MDYSRIIFENAGEASPASSPTYAFVGIYAQGDKLVFRLPLGYPVPSNPPTYETARDLHITFFKLFQRYRSIAQRNRERQKSGAAAHEDAGAALPEGREWIVRHEEGDVYYYRHFDAFDSLLEAFDALAILSLERRLRLIEGNAPELRHFDRTDAGRIYQNDDSFFDDMALHPAATLILTSSDLVGLYCFLVRDLRDHVWGERDPDPLQSDVRVLAEMFEVKHLWSSASCWEAHEWQRTRDALRDKLNLIDQVTSFKDEDYHRLYEAVMRFLYPPSDAPNGGILWGIDGFWPVWEWMVLSRLVAVEEFKDRLCWIETGNLSLSTVNALRQKGFYPPLQDERVLCHGGNGWDTFLTNGRRLGHPYPDAILKPASLKQQATVDKGVRWIEELTLCEGEVSMTISGTHDYLAVPLTPPGRVHFRTATSPNPPGVDEQKLVKPKLLLAGTNEPDLDRPEMFVMLRLLGEWDHGQGAFWRYAPFKSCRDVGRQHISGLLLVDAKYKTPEDNGALWAADHRKQAAYEDGLTIACPDTPAGYSIYVYPGKTVPAEPLAALLAQAAALEAQFEYAFEREWQNLPDREKYGYVFKQGDILLKVLGFTTKVIYKGNQKILAHNDLKRQVLQPVREDIRRRRLELALLGVDRFPGNDQFFLKSWPIQDLVDEVVETA